jgi:hypothetical protein
VIARRKRARRLLLWGFVLSIAFHFTVVPLLAWLFGARFAATQKQQQAETFIVTSSAARLERRPQPQRPSFVQPPSQQPVPRVVPRQQPEQAPKRELAKINPRAEISVPHRAPRVGPQTQSFSRQLEQQQKQFTQTIARLREENDPVISAAHPVATPAAMKRYVYDFSGNIGSPDIGMGILIPLNAWKDGPWDYYYVKYWVIYPDGTNETGNVPWPVRFPQTQDPIKLGWRHMPLPGPLPDYVLPRDANLHPLVAYCYEHHYASCPIAHD